MVEKKRGWREVERRAPGIAWIRGAEGGVIQVSCPRYTVDQLDCSCWKKRKRWLEVQGQLDFFNKGEIEFTHKNKKTKNSYLLKWVIQWFLIYLQSWTTVPAVYSRTFLSPQKEIQYPLIFPPILSHPQVPGNQSVSLKIRLLWTFHMAGII